MATNQKKIGDGDKLLFEAEKRYHGSWLSIDTIGMVHTDCGLCEGSHSCIPMHYKL